ncbi:MAG: hypothetical protein LLG00_02695 [Planctomycetaceae bacterium]|nr:hypothetical protein [Planctomycetaceae bacterium]
MSHLSSVRHWLLVAIVGFLIATPALAEEPKPRPGSPSKPATAKQSVEDAAKGDSGVAAILATKPTTPAERVRAAKILADLGRADLAKDYLKRVLDAKLNQTQLTELVDQLGVQTFVEISGQAALQPEAKKLADAVMAANRGRSQDAERIAGLIRQLQAPSEDKRFLAVAGLQDAGVAAINPLIAVLADPARSAEHENVRAVLAGMGRTARDALVAVFCDADAATRAQAIKTLAEMGDRRASIFLLANAQPLVKQPGTRQLSREALQQLIGAAPDKAEAAAMLYKTAKAYFDGRQAVDGIVDGKVEMWRWDRSQRRCVARTVTAAEAARTLAARFAADAVAIAPDDPQVRLLRLATMLEAAAYQKGPDCPWDDAAPALVEAREAGVSVLQRLLVDMMAQGHPLAAAAAAQLLGELGTASTLLVEGASASPLIQAVQSPDRRLRMAAVETIVRLQPSRPFAGSSYVLDALAFFAATQGTRGALVACPSLSEARDLAGLLATAGYRTHTSFDGRELLSQASRSADYEVALIDVTISRPTAAMLLQQLRHDPRTASIRVGLIAGAGYLDRAEHVAKSDPLTKAFTRPRDDKALRWQLDQLLAIAPQDFVSLQTRQRQAARALDLLAELSRSSNGLYDLHRVQGSVMATLAAPALAPKAVAVLANVNSAEAQRALVDVAGRSAQPLTLRQAAASAFRKNVRDHGVLLTVEEIRQRYDRYNQSEKEDRATQQLLARILDSIEASAPSARKSDVSAPKN